MSTQDVFEFEGEEITDFAVQIPSTKLDAAKAYPRGTILNMNVSFRVRSVRIDEDRQGNMIRTHLLAVEDAAVKKAVTPAERRAAMEAEEAAEVAKNADPVIQEEPGHEDGSGEAQPSEELTNDLTTDVVQGEEVEEDFSDVEARDQEQAQAVKGTHPQVQDAEVVDDEHQYADANAGF